MTLIIETFTFKRGQLFILRQLEHLGFYSCLRNHSHYISLNSSFIYILGYWSIKVNRNFLESTWSNIQVITFWRKSLRYNFWYKIRKKEAVAVHCRFGLGRVGTMLACYLVKTTNCSAAEAISIVRRKRPGSIETRGQEKLVQEFSLSLG